MTGPAQYYEIVERINQLSKEYDEKLAQIDGAFQRAMRWLDEAGESFGAFVETLRQACIRLYDWGKPKAIEFKNFIERFFTGFGVPPVMMSMDDQWLKIRDDANTVAGKVQRPKEDRLGDLWDGPAAEKYFSKVGPQVDAAKQLAKGWAEKAATTLQDMALAGIAFYTAFCGGIVVALGGLITVVLGLFGFQAAQDKWGSQLEGEATNPAGFDPGPAWPRAAAEVSDDVTTKDGDPADWKPKAP
jgi:hypothetical protein